ncbi:hypothetical protein dqs_3629 [Azoarcus olearius]|uniref:DUF3306 domain-containing protein n=1 Tax=Azoarcus sp. (strain BH72) TaxID=418699 RepID=UPI00080635F6|nr:DUF3306 domain-containing protein [Azoarcus olearius]ANQ86646.1 hypothetical protein dqs_3629 [Azoarcus olearius]
MSGGRFLARWSRLKRGEGSVPPAAPATVPEPVPAATPSAPPGAAAADAALPPTLAPGEALPPPEALTLESDFTAYLKDEVGEALRRQALKKLFSDPHFNVMDGLDIYIDDYSVSAPIPPDVLARLRHAQELLMEHGGVEAEEASAVDVGAAAPVSVEAADEGAGAVEGDAEAEADPDAPETLAARGPGSQRPG